MASLPNCWDLGRRKRVFITTQVMEMIRIISKRNTEFKHDQDVRHMQYPGTLYTLHTSMHQMILISIQIYHEINNSITCGGTVGSRCRPRNESSLLQISPLPRNMKPVTSQNTLGSWGNKHDTIDKTLCSI